ncbi:hypothetical protein ACQKND_22460 [Viridibacillus arvi]|uniref:hypothetical protein n=1 Tax=Viridibacillus arvi TaxID=263475 RepID=UPI003D069268
MLFLTLLLSACGDKVTDVEATKVKATTVKKAKKSKKVEVKITVTHEDSWWDIALWLIFSWKAFLFVYV